jgi:hypothetical protein
MAEVHEETRAGNGSAGEQARDKAQELAGQAQEKVQEAAGQARGRVAEQVDQRTTRAGEQLGSTAGDVRSVAEELRRQGKDAPAKYAEQAAERVERMGGYLRHSDGDRILRDVEDFGRRRPMAVVAAGLALGFVASRLLKASSGRRYSSSTSSTDIVPASAPGMAHATPPAPVPPAPIGAGQPPVTGGL